MPNLSQEKRQRMLALLDKIKEEHKNNDEILAALGEIENELTSKKYGLVWEKHEEEVDRMMQDNIPVFTEIKEREIKATNENSYNFLLEGDNLHSLKLLEKTHAGKIDVIYIDPPYNTGNQDFIYDDEFVDKTDGYTHSKWLSFMSERLEIAKRLLSDEGVIFISIDDNEQAQLKLLCDEIFGEENFIGKYIKQSKVGGGNDSKFIVKEHEYCECYAKKISATRPMYITHNKDYLKRYKEEDENGRYFWDTFARPGLKHPIIYDIIAPDGSVIRNGWIRSQERFNREYSEGKIRIIKKKNGQWSVQFKQYLNLDGKSPRSMTMDFGGTTEGDKELKEIFGKKIFSYPKSIKYLTTLISTIASENATILDFFAGSGTTAQAVLELNKEDGGNRKFILCTNNENNICEEVTYERIKRVIYGYADVEGIPANLKYFKTDFISKDADDVSEELLSHIKEMIELENGITLDNKHYFIVLSDEEADTLEKNWSNYEDVTAIYVSRNVLFTSEQNALFSNTEIHTIPDYYFEYELKEIGEIW